MKTILLILSQGRQSRESVSWSVRQAKTSGSQLLAVYIIDKDLTEEIENKVANIGFIGDKPGEQIADALRQEYESRGCRALQEVKRQCELENVSCETALQSGSFFEVCEELAGSKKADLIVFTEKQKSFFKSLFESSDLKTLKNTISTEIKAFSS